MSQAAPAKQVKGLTEVPLEDAMDKYGIKYTDTKVPKVGGFAGTNTIRIESLGGEEKSRHNATTQLPETLYLPLETDIGETVYALRIAKDDNGETLRDENGNAQWEKVTDQVIGAKFIDAVPQHQQDNGYPFTHNIIWETETGISFQTPLVHPTLSPMLKDGLPKYNTQHVFTSPEDMQAFIEKIDQNANGIWQGMRASFEAARQVPANDDPEPSIDQAPAAAKS